MGEQKKSKKVVRLGRRLPYGGDPEVDRDGISTINHHELWRRLVRAGEIGMHGPPGPPRPRKTQ